MRSIVLALSLSFTSPAIANTVIVKLNPISPHKSHGEFEVATEDKVDFQFRLESLKANQSYGIFLYAKGNCSKYSELVEPELLNKTGKIIKPEPGSNAYLLTRAASVGSSHGGYFAPHLLLHQLHLSGKIFVLEETKDGKPTGVAVACGVHP